MKATVSVKTVGTSFGKKAEVRGGDQVVHTTRTVPIDMPHEAWSLATSWCAEHGHTVQNPDGNL